MGRPPSAERMGEPKRGPWSPEEDILLVSYIQEHGPGNWRLLPNNAGLQRCGKSCRLRWKNYLQPGIKHGKYTPEEDAIIIRQQALLGNRWAAIAAHLPSRTDNDIKNYWNTHLKKRLQAKNNSSGAERANNHQDYIKASYDNMYKNAMAGNSITAAPQNNQLEKKSVYDDFEILSLTSIEKWLLEDPLAPVAQFPVAPPVAPVPQFPPAPVPQHDYVLNMFTPLGHNQFSFGPFY